MFSLKNSNLTAAATTTADDDEESSETRPVVAPNHDSISLTRANRSSNVNCNAVDSNKAILYADPWIRRCDQPISLDYIRTENQRQKSIQYETRLYYHAVPSTTSSERLSQQQQQCQSLLIQLTKISNMSNRDYVVKQLFHCQVRIRTIILMMSIGDDIHQNKILYKIFDRQQMSINICLIKSMIQHPQQQQQRQHLCHKNYHHKNRQQHFQQMEV